ncbi:TetR/AcrR family transcriptional regulator [Ktedonobacter racemifer]|uniref:Transcriptional regulator, TetR family n=1 Tax=Ktedonobacter racemifer DSM 44963 TaxID=485913 RepID=D6TZY7_KTERA|nr:TetR/AcrR family transcriptional regulator [Ktedonobacter racemifer]EFH82127.1 transcriptional regulator, TetR family [Ktedonobacter racemifer DSM 44963]
MPKVVDEQMREATRRHIIRQAASEFARLGFDQANINMIAEQAGIGKGTIYLYFENKRELFLSMLRYIAQDHLVAIRAALATDGSIQQRLERLFCAFVQLAQEERDSFNVHMSALYGVNRAFQAEATKLMRDYLATIAFMLEQSHARGEIRCANIESTSLMILSLMESFVLSANVLGQSEQVILQQANKVAEMVLHGIAST